MSLLLKRVDQQIMALERRARFQMTAERKRDTREKILLGGIVIRAGLSKADRAFLLGGFIELAKLTHGSAEHKRLCDIGEDAFKATSLNGIPSRIEEVAE
ncbi:hypothetical protein FHX14_002867 [Rhizobium sp. BK619]|nr:hypothetical protein [Rhizobium sp. BK619]